MSDPCLTLLERLRTQLEELVALHQSLRRELEQELEPTSLRHPAALLALQHRKQRILQRIGLLERQRQQVVAELAHRWNHPQGAALRLKSIWERLEGTSSVAENPAAETPASDIQPTSPAAKTLAAELKGYHQRLLASVEPIRQLAARNSAAAHARLKATRATLATIAAATESTHATYSDRGRLQQHTPHFKYTAV